MSVFLLFARQQTRSRLYPNKKRHYLESNKVIVQGISHHYLDTDYFVTTVIVAGARQGQEESEASAKTTSSFPGNQYVVPFASCLATCKFQLRIGFMAAIQSQDRNYSVGR